MTSVHPQVGNGALLTVVGDAVVVIIGVNWKDK
jgi:hypothetical protein